MDGIEGDNLKNCKTNINVCVYLNVYVCLRISVSGCMSVCFLHVFLYWCTFLNLYGCLFACLHLSMHALVCVVIFMCALVFAIHTENLNKMSK